MTTRLQLELGSHLVSGLATTALFVMMVVVSLGALFPNPQGFPEGANITASIDYSTFSLGFKNANGENMLVIFEIIDFVFVVALAGAVLLARREDTTGRVRTILIDGGRELRRMLFDDEGDDN